MFESALAQTRTGCCGYARRAPWPAVEVGLPAGSGGGSDRLRAGETEPQTTGRL